MQPDTCVPIVPAPGWMQASSDLNHAQCASAGWSTQAIGLGLLRPFRFWKQFPPDLPVRMGRVAAELIIGLLLVAVLNTLTAYPRNVSRAAAVAAHARPGTWHAISADIFSHDALVFRRLLQHSTFDAGHMLLLTLTMFAVLHLYVRKAGQPGLDGARLFRMVAYSALSAAIYKWFAFVVLTITWNTPLRLQYFPVALLDPGLFLLILCAAFSWHARMRGGWVAPWIAYLVTLPILATMAASALPFCSSGESAGFRAVLQLTGMDTLYRYVSRLSV